MPYYESRRWNRWMLIDAGRAISRNHAGVEAVVPTAWPSQALGTRASPTAEGFVRGSALGAPSNILNVSSDVVREFYQEYNLAFAQAYGKQNGVAPTVDLSNGGSSKQARAVIYGWTGCGRDESGTDIDEVFGGWDAAQRRTLRTADTSTKFTRRNRMPIPCPHLAVHP